MLCIFFEITFLTLFNISVWYKSHGWNIIGDYGICCPVGPYVAAG
jgi:hypothetical protein